MSEEQKTEWGARTRKHYPIDPQPLQLLVEMATEVPIIRTFVWRHVPESELTDIERVFKELHGTSISVEGIFGVMPGIRKQTSLSETDVAWFAKVADFYRLVTSAAQKHSSSEDTANITYISKMNRAASMIDDMLKAIKERAVESPPL